MKMNYIIASIAILLVLPAHLYASTSEEIDMKIKALSELYENMDLTPCKNLIRDLLNENLSNDQKLEVLKYKAVIELLEEREYDAKQTIRQIYLINPDFILDNNYPPKFSVIFDSVKHDIVKDREEEKGKNITAINVDPQDEIPSDSPITTTAVNEKKNKGRKISYPALGLFSSGTIALTTGIILRIIAHTEAEDYKNTIKNADVDEAGYKYTILPEDVENKQNDLNRKVLISYILIGSGTALISGGILSYLIYDKDKENNTALYLDRDRVSFFFKTDF